MAQPGTVQKTTKQKITIWVDPIVAARLTDMARDNHLTVSQAGAEIVRVAVLERTANIARDLLTPRLEQVVRREISRMSDRTAALLARSALEAATGRRLLVQLLGRTAGADVARQLNEQAWGAAIAALRAPVTELVELIQPPATLDGD